VETTENPKINTAQNSAKKILFVFKTIVCPL